MGLLGIVFARGTEERPGGEEGMALRARGDLKKKAGIGFLIVMGVKTCALPIYPTPHPIVMFLFTRRGAIAGSSGGGVQEVGFPDRREPQIHRLDDGLRRDVVLGVVGHLLRA